MKTVNCRRAIIYTVEEVLEKQHTQQEEPVPEAQTQVCDTLL